MVRVEVDKIASFLNNLLLLWHLKGITSVVPFLLPEKSRPKNKKGDLVMTVNDALKMLYEKMGGTADVSGVTTSSEMIDYIEDVAGSGGSGGAGGVYVETTLNVAGQYEVEYVSTTTAAAVITALQAGSSVVFHVPASDYQFEMYLAIWGYIPENNTNDSDAKFLFGYGDSWGNLTSGGKIGEDGYIHFAVYVD